MSFVNRANQSFATHARLWYIIDARDQVCGRLACFIGQILQGKTKPIYHHSLDVGDYLVVTNTRHITLTGAKWNKKIYRHHTGYPGGLKEVVARNLHRSDGTRILWRAVYGMLPKNNLRPIWMKRLYLFEDKDHPYAENIFSKLEAPASLPKRLTEFTPEEIANYPRIYWFINFFLSSSGQTVTVFVSVLAPEMARQQNCGHENQYLPKGVVSLHQAGRPQGNW